MKLYDILKCIVMKVFLSNINESWVVDRFRKDWYTHNPSISTRFINLADIIWIISPWLWKSLPNKHLTNKKVICSIYHIDFENFDEKEEIEFKTRDQFVDLYHVISENTKNQLKNLTNKKIVSLPFWVDQNIFYFIEEKNKLRSKYNFLQDEYLIGSFQRDTEGSDLKSPKLIKGPDVFLELVTKIYEKNNKTKIVLTGKRRNYLIDNLKKRNIPFKYFEMINQKSLNELYNILDLYLVTSRIEGGPQAVLECGITKTPILSTNVGVAPEILSRESLFKLESFDSAKVDTDYAYKQSLKFVIPKGMLGYREMFKLVYES